MKAGRITKASPEVATTEAKCLAMYNDLAERHGTKFEPASPGCSMLIGGAITKHPLRSDVAESLMLACRAVGGEAKLVWQIGRGLVYLAGCSFAIAVKS